jgi:tetratricopeptide (TPR) repeat protein
MLVAAKLKQTGDIDQYFHDLAGKFASNAALQSRILFSLGTYTYQKAQDAGLAAMRAAYNPAVKYAPADLDLYGMALLDRALADDAYAVYQKIATDYPLPAGAAPSQAPPAIQEAQATALFGMATVLQKQNKIADAGKLYAQLKASYPWSPKVVEANFGIAQSLFNQGKYDDASKLLVGIVGSRTATAELRAHAFLLIGDIQAAKGNIPAAIDSYLKTAAFFAGVPDAASQGLWRGGQMLERQAAALTEQSTPKKSEQMAKAVTAYKNIVAKYPDSTLVPQAQERLRALGT